ncbi:MAG: hypothetical protein OXM55_05655 [Bdellovibrionales bacterium]|nr:hypothetical protein [Bdellovibrionales bacterium]
MKWLVYFLFMFPNILIGCATNYLGHEAKYIKNKRQKKVSRQYADNSRDFILPTSEEWEWLKKNYQTYDSHFKKKVYNYNQLPDKIKWKIFHLPKYLNPDTRPRNCVFGTAVQDYVSGKYGQKLSKEAQIKCLRGIRDSLFPPDRIGCFNNTLTFNCRR